MKSAPLPKGQSQLQVKATLRHRAQVNDETSVTFEVEPTEAARERYLGWVAVILDAHSCQDRTAMLNAAGVWKTKYKRAERLLRAVMDHLAPLVTHSESSLPRQPETEHPVLAAIRSYLDLMNNERQPSKSAGG